MDRSLVRAQSFYSWTALPDMPTARWNSSALCVNDAPDVVLVVGGENEHDYLSSAELLVPSRTGQPWRWRRLTPMLESRLKPGVLLLLPLSGNEENHRVLVAGGGRNTAELLTIAYKNTSDRGQWTLISPLSRRFFEASLICFNGRIFAIGRFHVFPQPYTII